MNPNVDKLPVPDTNLAGVNTAGVELGALTHPVEKAPSKEMGNVTPPQSTAAVLPPATKGVDSPHANPILPVTDDVATAAVPPAAEPDEEFEKKWVNAAKAIVERTKDDPHLQSQELSKTGREYREKLRSRS